jgi:flagellar M-ring protein FliF
MPPQLQLLIDKLGGRSRVLILAIGLGAAMLILGLARWSARPQWVPAFSGLPLEAVGKVTEQLDGAGIAYELDAGGTTVRVAATDLARARVVVAGQGGIPSAGRPGLELFDQPSWGMTDFTQRVNYRRALEGELERTIGKMRGVERAQVHLALHERASFRDGDRPSEASVVLSLAGGGRPAADVVRGIQQLVASSVDGVEAKDVAIVDDAGRLLSIEEDPSSPEGLSSAQLKLQREVESYLEGKATDLVGRIVGAENVRVQVAATLNFDRVERTVQSVDPERQAMASEQRAEIVPGAEGGAGSVNSAVSYENTRSLETWSGSVGNVRRLTVAVLVNDRLAPVADSAAPPASEPRSPVELARIEALVRNAVGVDSARGDGITVTSIPFSAPVAVPVAAPAPTVEELVQTYWRPGLSALAVLLAFAIALVVLRSLRAPAVAPPVPALAAAGAAESLPLAPEMAALPAEGGISPVARPMPTRTVEVMNPVLREQAVVKVAEQPEIAARVVRAWLKEE